MLSVKNAVTIEDLQKLARKRLPKFIISYAERGAGSGACSSGNVEAFLDYHFSPKALVGNAPIDMSTDLFGRTYAQPFGISAIGLAGIYRQHADEILAETARNANVPFILSGSGTADIETIAKLAPEHSWYQLYPAKDPAITENMISRARNAGVQVLVITVDYPEPNRSEVKERTGISVGRGPTLKTLPSLALDAARHPHWLIEFLASGGTPKLESWQPYAPKGAKQSDLFEIFNENWCGPFDWLEVERIRKLWPGKMVIKGISRAGDIRRAVAAGADAVTISNHGGNKLDRVLPSLRALSQICKEQKDAYGIPLFFDGGIRRGTDVLTALAIGASFCFLGRAALFGVAAGGAAGAQRAMDIMKVESAHALAMIGCRAARDLDESFLA